jgi:alkyl hydroperoxide reductase subunit AhpC
MIILILEIIAFNESIQQFRQINCEVLGCSTDSHFSHFAWYKYFVYYYKTEFFYIGLQKIVNKVVLVK